jgi:hypothetical protein
MKTKHLFGMMALFCVFFIFACPSPGPENPATPTNPPAEDLVITKSTLKNGKVNVAYSDTITATGASGTYAFSISGGSLPTGLSLDAASGVISGTPTTIASYSFSVKVEDSADKTKFKEKSYTIVIADKVSITTTSLPKGVNGFSYNAHVVAAGGFGQFQYSIKEGSGNLPNGLSLNSTTGIISGTPNDTNKVYNFTVKVADSIDPIDFTEKTLSIELTNKVIISTSSLPFTKPGRAYSAVITIANSPAHKEFSSTNLPVGLTINAETGVISGTITDLTPQTYNNVKIKISDSDDITNYDERTFNIVVYDFVNITTATIRNFVNGASYLQSVVAEKGTGSYNFEISAGSLPTGLSINQSTGVISGTPNAMTGAFSFTVKVSDSNDPIDFKTRDFSIALYDKIAITTLSLENAIKDDATYSHTVSSTGGSGAYKNTISSGSLPAGLSINSATGTISGTPNTAGSYSFTVRCEDVNDSSNYDTKSYTVKILTQVVITTASLPNCAFNTAYNQNINVAGGAGNYTFTIVSGNLPAWLTLNNSTGNISGTADNNESTYNFTIKVVDNELSSNSSQKNLSITVKTYKWNIMVYMAADNNLEQYAISDLNEMEGVSGLDNSNVNLIVLVDRISGYSTDDGDWKGTRLYKIKYDSIMTDTNIRSTRLSGMGLSNSGDADELNMADPANLTNFVQFVKTNYPATNNMLIMWNHGSGWRNSTAPYVGNAKVLKSGTAEIIKNISKAGKATGNDNNSSAILSNSKIFINNDYGSSVNPVKSICEDVTSNDILYNSEVRTALTGLGLNVIGFDACLMGMIESIYEFKGIASYMIASPDSIPGDGWDYKGWLSGFLATDLSAVNLYTTAIDSYAAYYSSTQTACLAAYDLSAAGSLYSAYNNFATDLNNYMWNTSHITRSGEIADIIISNTEQYVTPTAGGNFHLDVYDLANNFPALANSSALKTAIDNTVVYKWTQPGGTIFTGNPRSHGIAVYFATFTDSSLNIGLLNDYLIGNYTLFTTNSIWPGFLRDLYQFPNASAGTWAYATTYNDPSITLGSGELYFIYATGSGTVTGTLSNYGTNDLDLYLYDSSGNQLRSSTSTNPTEYISYNLPQKGWYVFAVHHYAGSTTGYRLAITGANIR